MLYCLALHCNTALLHVVRVFQLNNTSLTIKYIVITSFTPFVIVSIVVKHKLKPGMKILIVVLKAIGYLNRQS